MCYAGSMTPDEIVWHAVFAQALTTTCAQEPEQTEENFARVAKLADLAVMRLHIAKEARHARGPIGGPTWIRMTGESLKAG